MKGSLITRSTSHRLALTLLVTLVVAACGPSTPPPTGQPTPAGSLGTPTGALATAQPSVDPTSAPSADPTATPTATPETTPTPSPTPPPEAVQMPFVPVVNFWSTREAMPLDEVKAALQGSSSRYAPIVVPADDADALASATGVTLGASVERGTVADVIAAAKAGGLGFLRATDVDPSVRALGINGAHLFGNDRVADIGEWPLTATVQSTSRWDQSKNWVLVSAGDIMGDRGVRTAVEDSGRGPSYLFDGGTSKVDRLRCCSFFNYTYPVVSRTGNAGAVKAMIRNADLAIANLETGVLPNAPFHDTGFTFTTDPSYLEAIKDAGFDYLSNANNHSRNGGARGLSTALETLDQLGILRSGAGVGPEAAAQPAVAEINGVKVAIIACDAIARGYWAKPGKLGTNSCRDGSVSRTIRQTRDTVDVIIVFPHWGIEYELPGAYQYELSDEWIDAGADMIIGAHNHFPGAIYEYKGHVSMFSMGNFIFDQDFRQTTLMGLVVETTWNGNKPVQIWVHPLLNVNAQPNFADPDTDGQWAFNIMKWQSRRLDWGGEPHGITGYPMR